MTTPKTAIVTGITGQDGAYLAAALLSRGYSVYGTYRRTSSANFWRIEELGVERHPQLKLVEYDLLDLSSCLRLVEKARPDEIYNLAAQSFVAVSFDQPLNTALVTGVGPLNLLEAIRILDRKIRFYQASTSEMFGKVQATPQNETTPFYPRSPYGVAKLYAHWSTINYRDAHGIFGVSGILFNHESPLRGMEFVTRKITNAVARIRLDKQEVLELGNLDARRDWGYAEEYVAGIEIVWRGTGTDETGVDPKSGKTRVRINPAFYRPAEVDLLIGDAALAHRELGWQARTSLETLCGMMVEADLKRVARGVSF